MRMALSPACGYSPGKVARASHRIAKETSILPPGRCSCMTLREDRSIRSRYPSVRLTSSSAGRIAAPSSFSRTPLCTQCARGLADYSRIVYTREFHEGSFRRKSRRITKVSVPRVWIRRLTFLGRGLATLVPLSTAQSLDPKLYSEMRWRTIGPTRAGRARAVAGSPSHPNVAYIGFDNGGVWRPTDYGSTWTPIFDNESTGSIGSIAVAPSDANTIYVGTGAGIIRPDLATGDGMYKSTDGGKTWTHLGLRDSQMIANIDVDSRNPNRLFAAVLGHPYGPNPERGIFRSTDGGATFDNVLFKDDYTSGNDVRIDPKDANVVYATLWQQQQGFMENGAFPGAGAGAGGGIFKSTDGGNNWRPLTAGLPAVTQANLTISLSNPKVVYAMVAGAAGAAAGGANPAPAPAPAAGGR